MRILEAGLTTSVLLCMGLTFGAGCDGGDEGGDDSLAEETAGEGEGDGGDGDGDGDTSGSVDTGNNDFGDSGELTGCAANPDESSCVDAPGCSPVHGSPLLEETEGSWCTLAEEEYIGCVSSGDLCPPSTKILCADDGIWQTGECVPDNASVCELPGEITGECA